MKAQKKTATVGAVAAENTLPNFNTSIARIFNGELVTDSLAIAQEFGRKQKDVLRSLDNLIENGTIWWRKSAPPDYIDARGKTQRVIELAERDFLIAMPFIGGKKSQQGQVRLVDTFLSMRAEAAGQAAWGESRKAAAVGYITISETLQETREGKAIAGYHYSNESEIINGILFGNAGAVDRRTLSSKQLSLLVRTEIRTLF